MRHFEYLIDTVGIPERIFQKIINHLMLQLDAVPDLDQNSLTL